MAYFTPEELPQTNTYLWSRRAKKPSRWSEAWSGAISSNKDTGQLSCHGMAEGPVKHPVW
jgi:hypothetical protein